MDIQAEIKKVDDEMGAMLSKCESEKRDMSDDEKIRYDGLDIKRRGLEASATQTRRSIPSPARNVARVLPSRNTRNAA